MGGVGEKTPTEKEFELREVEERDEAYQTTLSCAPVDGVVWLSISQWMYSWSGQLAGGMQLEQILPRTGLMAVSYYA